ncbi:MAG: trigger factor [Sphingomicrobium sp.]
MSIKTVETETEGLKRAFMLTIPAADIEARVDEEVKKIAPQVRMPGFRPGKVPPNLIRKMHGDSLRQDALNGSVQAGVEELLFSNGIRPAVRPEVVLKSDYEPGNDAEVSVTVEALPKIPDPDVSKLELERLAAEVTDKEVQAQLKQLAGQSKKWSDAPGKHSAQLGDLVVMDFVGSVKGKPFEGGAGTGMSIELGSGRLIPGFEDQLVGVKAGEQRIATVTFPADYPVADLKGKEAQFDIKVSVVRTASENAVDEDFAKSLGLTGLDQLTELIRGQLQQELNTLIRTHMKRQLLDVLAVRHDFEVPKSMVEAEYQNIFVQLRQEAAREADPTAAFAELEKDKDEFHRIAERRVRLGLLLSEVGAKSGVQVSDQEMNQIVSHHASQYQGQDRDNFMRMVQQDSMFAAQLRAPLYEDKVVDYLFSTAKISERSGTREQLEADLESEEGHVHGPGCGHDHGTPAKAKGKGKAKPAKAVKAEPKSSPKAEAPKPAKPLKDGPSGKPATKPAKSAAKPAPKAKAEAPKPAKPVKDGAGSKPATKSAKPALKVKAVAKPAAAKKAPAKKVSKKTK